MNLAHHKALTITAVMVILGISQSTSAKSELAVTRIPSSQAVPAPAEVPVAPRRLVLVSIPDRKLAVLEHGKVVRIFQVAVGADVSPSPVGGFQIAHRLANPTYYHPGVVIPAGKDNPLGPRWVGLSQKGFGIHGTNQPWSIGKAASHGCIRMRNRDIEQFFEMVSIGDAVEIRSQRDAQIAQIFAPAQGTTALASVQAQASPDNKN